MVAVRWHVVTSFAAFLLALGWAFLPSAGSTGETLTSHARLLGHLVGWLPPLRDGKYGRHPTPARRPSNGTITEVQGFVSPEEFRSKYLWKDPVVFRGAATRDWGFDLECLTGNGSVVETLARDMGDQKFRIFQDQYDDASADFLSFHRYMDLAKAAAADPSKPVPYPRAFPQQALGRCAPVPEAMMKTYHSWIGRLFQRLEDASSVVFMSLNEGSNTKMHFDVGNSLFTQVHGRKRWLFVDPQYAAQLQVYADRLNLVYIAGYDVHNEPLPSEVPIREVILHPGDVLYFAPMTFHAVYNLDPVTIGVDNPSGDPVGALYRHWMFALATMLNPWVPIKALMIKLRTGSVTGTDIYFDGFSSHAKRKTEQVVDS